MKTFFVFFISSFLAQPVNFKAQDFASPNQGVCQTFVNLIQSGAPKSFHALNMFPFQMPERRAGEHSLTHDQRANEPAGHMSSMIFIVLAIILSVIAACILIERSEVLGHKHALPGGLLLLEAGLSILTIALLIEGGSFMDNDHQTAVWLCAVAAAFSAVTGGVLMFKKNEDNNRHNLWTVFAFFAAGLEIIAVVTLF